LVLAAVVGALSLFVALLAWRRSSGGLRRLALAVGGLVVLQISLGFATWVAKYRYPDWFPLETLAETRWEAGSWEPGLAAGTLTARTAGGWGETHTVTAHSAIGSLLFATSTALAVAAGRRRWMAADASPTTTESAAPILPNKALPA
jgi:hypothetical protein